MKNSYCEIICDYCGNAEHYNINVRGKQSIIKDLRKNGWILTNDGKHFDSKECYNNYKARGKAEWEQ